MFSQSPNIIKMLNEFRVYFSTLVLLLFFSSLSAQTISVLSWNIKFLPRAFAHIGHRPLKRVEPIATHLIASEADVLVLQEAFDRKAKRRLKKSLNLVYPYTYGPANQEPGFKINSGILILSKTPLLYRGEVEFSDCEKEDCFARKGALLVETVVAGRRIQVLGTHLEAGGPSSIKLTQYHEVAGLLRSHQLFGIPQIICGDFNTNQTNTYLYQAMLNILQAEDGPLYGELQYTSDHMLNDMDLYNPNDRKVIDYVFYKPNGVQPQNIYREVLRYQYPWNKKQKDLSDHFAVWMKLTFDK